MTSTVSTLSQTFVFRGTGREILSALAGMGVEKTFMGGDTVVRQYDKNQDLVVILEGRVQIRNYRGEVLAELEQGAVLGEVSLLDQSPRSANVVSLGPCKALFIPASVIRSYMDSDGEFENQILRNLSRLLCSRLRSMNALVETSRPLGRRAS